MLPKELSQPPKFRFILFERWSGKYSFRAKIGTLWFGMNLKTLGVFVLLEGGPQFLSWNPIEKFVLRALALALIIALLVAILPR